MAKIRHASKPSEAVRLVKTWLPASLVREMDQTILGSNGAYEGRDDFIRESISDRVADERSRPDRTSASVIRLHSSENRGGKASSEKPRGMESPGSLKPVR